jgi:hypothetical protein
VVLAVAEEEEYTVLLLQKTQLATAAVAAEVHIPIMVEVEVME